MKRHVSSTVNTCFFCPTSCGHRYHEAAGVCLHLSWLDYCNAVVYGLPQSTISSLQLVQNAAARVTLGLSPCGHVCQALKEQCWLPVTYHIQYKVVFLMFFLSTPDRSANPAQHHRRPIILCDCRMCMEQSSYQHHSINVFAIFQETT